METIQRDKAPYPYLFVCVWGRTNQLILWLGCTRRHQRDSSSAGGRRLEPKVAAAACASWASSRDGDRAVGRGPPLTGPSTTRPPWRGGSGGPRNATCRTGVSARRGGRWPSPSPSGCPRAGRFSPTRRLRPSPVGPPLEVEAVHRKGAATPRVAGGGGQEAADADAGALPPRLAADGRAPLVSVPGARERRVSPSVVPVQGKIEERRGTFFPLHPWMFRSLMRPSIFGSMEIDQHVHFELIT